MSTTEIAMSETTNVLTEQASLRNEAGETSLTHETRELLGPGSDEEKHSGDWVEFEN